MDRYLTSGHSITGDENGHAVILTHMDCGDSYLAAFSGGAPTLAHVNEWAAKHRCGLPPWRKLTASDLAAL